jgi:molecular chaperone GrpE
MPEENVQTENFAGAGPGLDAAEIDNLRKLAAERDQYLDMAQRQRAEFENYQKRARKERDEERRYLHGALVHDLLPVIDNLERALGAAQQAGDAGSLVQGVAMVQAQFLEQLKRHGVTRIEAQGKPFDPNLHQAVMQQPSADAAPGTVLQVLEPGYLIHDRVLRPAKVIVSASL